jgi:hypothetical protein
MVVSRFFIDYVPFTPKLTAESSTTTLVVFPAWSLRLIFFFNHADGFHSSPHHSL